MTENAVVVKASEVRAGDNVLANQWVQVSRIDTVTLMGLDYLRFFCEGGLIGTVHHQDLVSIKSEIDIEALVKRWAAKEACVSEAEIGAVVFSADIDVFVFAMINGEWREIAEVKSVVDFYKEVFESSAN